MPDASTSVSSPSLVSTWRTSAPMWSGRSGATAATPSRAEPAERRVDRDVGAGRQPDPRQARVRPVLELLQDTRRSRRRARRPARAGGRRPAARGARAPSGCAGSRGRTSRSATSDTAASRRAASVPIEPDEAAALRSCASAARILGGDRRRRARDLDPVEREERRLPRGDVQRRPPPPTSASATTTASSGRRPLPTAVRGSMARGHAARFGSPRSAAVLRTTRVRRQLEVAEELDLALEHDPELVERAPARLGHQRERVAPRSPRRRSR